MNTCWKKRIRAAAAVSVDKGEFWALVGQDGNPVSPYAWSQDEFELKLVAAGIELTRREIPPVEAGLPAGFCAEYRIRTFEVRRTVSSDVSRSF